MERFVETILWWVATGLGAAFAVVAVTVSLAVGAVPVLALLGWAKRRRNG